jgi:hypothetical protein
LQDVGRINEGECLRVEKERLARFGANPIARWTMRILLLVPWFPIAVAWPAAVAQALSIAPLWVLLPRCNPILFLLWLISTPIQACVLFVLMLMIIPLGTLPPMNPATPILFAFWGSGYISAMLIVLVFVIPVESALRRKRDLRA